MTKEYSKTYEELTTWARQDEDRWQKRNWRFQRDQDLYSLKQPEDVSRWTRNQADLMILNDPKVLVKKAARLIARHPNNIEVVANAGVPVEVAQRIENYLYGWDQSINLAWMAGLNHPYRYDQAFFIVLRGWLCERTMLRPEGLDYDPQDPAALYDHQVFDPANVYPTISGGRVTRVCHTYKTRVSDVRDDPLFDKVPEMADMEPNQEIEVRACYWLSTADGPRGTWYHAVVLDGEKWGKKPTEIGYNPWTITIANGSSYRAVPWGDEDYLEQIGTGILDESTENQSYLNKAATKLNALLSNEANPPLTVFSADGSSRKVSLADGARNFMTMKDKVEVHRVGPQMGDYQLLWNILMQRAERAGLPKEFFGESPSNGVASSVAMSAGRDILFPFTEALNHADGAKYRKVLELYRDFGPSRPLNARMPANALGQSMSADITAMDIAMQGTMVEVSRVDMTPMELAQKINLALSMVKTKVMSMDTARGKDWIGMKNPSKENAQIIAESVFMDPTVIQAMVPLALSATGQPMLAQVWSMLQNGVPPQEPAMGQGGGMMEGLPSQTLAPQLQSGNPFENARVMDGIPAETNDILGLLTGGATGGAGFGGNPPPPDMVSPIARFLPPGRGGPF